MEVKGLRRCIRLRRHVAPDVLAVSRDAWSDRAAVSGSLQQGLRDNGSGVGETVTESCSGAPFAGRDRVLD
jgi:hypothetical protein